MIQFEMERDAFIAHGARGWLGDRFSKSSDESTSYFCPKCELPCIANATRNLYVCEVCHTTDPVPRTSVPRSFQLLYGYNAALGVRIGVRTGVAPAEAVEPQRRLREQQ